MSWMRNNLLYVIIFALILFLLVFTIQLQYLMLQVQPGAEPTPVVQAPTVIFPTPTPFIVTPVVILTPPPLPSATPVPPTPIPPTATAIQPAPATFTATALPPTPLPTSTPASVAILQPTATTTKAAQPAVDFRLGYLDRGDDCPVITEIVQTVLEKEFGYQVAAVAFPTADDLFATLTANDEQQKIDWTMCYLDPTDRPFLQKYGGFFVVIGGIYWRDAGNNYQIMANGLRKKAIQQEQPCVYTFLKNFKLENVGLNGQDAISWLADHQDLVRTWTSCQ